jgi:predicted transcriptional regulator
VNEMSLVSRKKGNNLEIVYESKDVVVMLGPHEDTLTELILDVIKRKGSATIKEIHSELKTIASEEKIRRVMNTLRKSKIVNSTRGKYFLLQPNFNEKQYF